MDKALIRLTINENHKMQLKAPGEASNRTLSLDYLSKWKNLKHWTHSHEEFLLLLFLLLGLLPHGLVFLLQLLQRSDLRLLEAVRLLLVVRSESGQLLLVALVLLTQRLKRREEVGVESSIT